MRYSKLIVAISCAMIILGGLVEVYLCIFNGTMPSDVFWGLWFAAWEGELWALRSIKVTEIAKPNYDDLSKKDIPNESDKGE